MRCVSQDCEAELTAIQSLAMALEPCADLAVVIDLPGAQAVRLGLGLALRGFRPVPVVDGSPGAQVPSRVTTNLADAESASNSARPTAIVDMRETLHWLCVGAQILSMHQIPSNARPVFILDSLRSGPAGARDTSLFDNRWKTFPEEYPSARFLKEQGIQRVLLIQDTAKQPSEDLAHVLLRWEEGGIAIWSASAVALGAPQSIHVQRPSRFRALWYRFLERVGMKGGIFDLFEDWPHGSGG
jgi:hypothetical protein